MKSEEKKKVLFVVEAMGGGVFTYIVNLSNELVDKYDMYIAYAVRKQTPDDFQKYFDPKIKLIQVKNFERSIKMDQDIKAFFELRSIAKAVKPDIIHLHSSKAGALGRLAFDGHKVPVFYTPHGYSFLMENHSLVKRLVYRGIEVLCAKRCCTTISCSEGEHQETLKITKRATYVNNGINIKEMQSLMDHVNTDDDHQFTVFTLGRICHQKNPELFNKVAMAMPDVKFLWIGDGELKNSLTAPNIEVTGWTKREEALEKAMGGDVFLLTSLWEGLPVSLLEAMYMKKYCVVSNVIGNRDVIINNKNGFVCDQADEFAEAIKAVRAGKNSRMVENAYRDILNRYNTGVMARSYDWIYQNHIAKGQRSWK